jgi:hypothetical protein
MRGLSGAVVVVNDNDTVTKSGGIPERTREQGEWLQRHGGDMFPRVVELLPDGYVMEKLTYIDYWDVGSDFNIATLRSHVWTQPAVVAPTADSGKLLLAKMQHTIDKYLYGSITDKIELEILDNAKIAAAGLSVFEPCLTHGDPTAENVMVRDDFGKVFIDPIRATEVVPDSPIIDVGKVLQSAYGWEDAKYQTGAIAYRRSDIADALDDDDMLHYGDAWAVIHVMRAIPYVLRNIPESYDRVISVLMRALERW